MEYAVGSKRKNRTPFGHNSILRQAPGESGSWVEIRRYGGRNDSNHEI